MRLVATQAYPYGRRALKAGDLFDADEEDGRLLCGFGKARLHKVANRPPDWSIGEIRKHAVGDYVEPLAVRPVDVELVERVVFAPKQTVSKTPGKKWRGGRYNRSDVRASD